MTIAKQSIQDILARADVVAEIGARVGLKKAGTNYVGLCPFHGEKSPSFSVSPAKQFFHCFGCGKSGDVIQFLMEHDGMQFHEAVRDLGERLGIKVDEDQDEHDIQTAQDKRKVAASLEDLCEKATHFYRHALKSSPDASEYVNARGLSKEVMDLYGIGYAPNVVSHKALAAVFADYTSSQGLIDAGLVAFSEVRQERFDRFRDRLMFPIRDVRGRCIGFGGRVINKNSPNAPKYLNSPETPIFIKHRVLYGLHEARSSIMQEKTAFVSEGYMDVVGMAQYGIGNAVAALGTALTEDHLRLLLRFTDKICFMFDGDAPGQKAAWKSLQVALPLLEAKHSFTFLTLPENKDPDEYLRAYGRDQFLAAARSAPTLSQYLVTSLLKQFGTDGKLTSAEAKTQFMVKAEELCSLIADANPLKGLLLREIDQLIGRTPRFTDRHTSARERFSQANLGAANGEPKRPWLSREEWLKNVQHPKLGVSPAKHNVYAPAAPPELNKKSVWARMTEAVVKAPLTAVALRDEISTMLDPDFEEEQILIIALENAHTLPNRPERYAPDELQVAVDILTAALVTIKRQRLLYQRELLKLQLTHGDIAEEAYVREMSRLG